MAELSPAAQAVKDAAQDAYWLWDSMCPADAETIAAAALRAVADQVAPSDAMEPRNYLPMAIECQRIRSDIFAIAAELEGTNPTSEGDYDHD